MCIPEFTCDSIRVSGGGKPSARIMVGSAGGSENIITIVGRGCRLLEVIFGSTGKKRGGKK